MRIDRLYIENFKKYTRQELQLHPQFTLLVGENGAGKTSLLDALAVAAAIWLVDAPDVLLANSGRTISPATEIRLRSEFKGDRIQFLEERPVIVRATGRISDVEDVTWTRQIRPNGIRTSNADAKTALNIIANVYRRDGRGEDVLCPVLAYYGAGRGWLASNARVPKKKNGDSPRRWSAFYDCFSERIRFSELSKWFSRETVERGNRGGQSRPGFTAVKQAILSCVPGSNDVWFDADLDQIVLSIQDLPCPLNTLSAGQKMMLALVADIAIKAVTQNAFLLSPDEIGTGPIPAVLAQTPGIVLIDELDVHLHPRWQRRVASDLKAIFPSIQFVCTSHSPQVIGELQPDEIRLLDGEYIGNPAYSFGIDSSRILEELMSTNRRDPSVDTDLATLAETIDREDFTEAKRLLEKLVATFGSDDPEVTRASALINFLELPV